jgi:hypothetical protein
MKEKYTPELNGKKFKGIRKKLRNIAINLALRAELEIGKWDIFISMSRKEAMEKDMCHVEGCSEGSISFVAHLKGKAYLIKFSARDKMSYGMLAKLTKKSTVEGGAISFGEEIFEKSTATPTHSSIRVRALKRPSPISLPRRPALKGRGFIVTLSSLTIPAVASKLFAKESAAQTPGTERLMKQMPMAKRIIFDRTSLMHSFRTIFDAIGDNLGGAFLRNEAREWITGREKDRKNGQGDKMIALLVRYELFSEVRGSHLKMTDFGSKVGLGLQDFPETDLKRKQLWKSEDPFKSLDDDTSTTAVRFIQISSLIKFTHGKQHERLSKKCDLTLTKLEKMLANNPVALHAIKFICSV